MDSINMHYLSNTGIQIKSPIYTGNIVFIPPVNYKYKLISKKFNIKKLLILLSMLIGSLLILVFGSLGVFLLFSKFTIPTELSFPLGIIVAALAIVYWMWIDLYFYFKPWFIYKYEKIKEEYE